MQAKSVFTGVDYIRLTASDHKPLAAWKAICLPEFVAEEKAGRREHMRWLMGYFGRIGEHCFVGENDSGCMIQLSGATAWDRWYDAGNHSQKCTRIDLQVTYPLDGEPGQYIRDMYEVGQLARKQEGHPPGLQLTDTPEGAKMLTIGSRQSEVFARMYDKARESHMPEYASCVRWELEMKGGTAVDMNGYMREHRGEAGTTRAIVKNYFERRGMTPFWDTYEGMEARPPAKRSKTDETKVAWLATQVRPTVQVLREHGKDRAMLRALFGDDLTDRQIDAILSAIGESDPS